MVGGEDWVMRPAVRGLCSAESLLDGKLDLADVALLNHAIDVNDSNTRAMTPAGRR